jgi:excisionase family DNA binding protein
MQQPGGVLGPQATPAAAPAAAPSAAVPATPPPLPGAVALLSPAEAAQALGVTEADVLSTLEAGDLKGKKIGSTWRITQAALDDFLKS